MGSGAREQGGRWQGLGPAGPVTTLTCQVTLLHCPHRGWGAGHSARRVRPDWQGRFLRQTHGFWQSLSPPEPGGGAGGGCDHGPPARSPAWVPGRPWWWLSQKGREAGLLLTPQLPVQQGGGCTRPEDPLGLSRVGVQTALTRKVRPAGQASRTGHSGAGWVGCPVGHSWFSQPRAGRLCKGPGAGRGVRALGAGGKAGAWQGGSGLRAWGPSPGSVLSWPSESAPQSWQAPPCG